MTMFPLIHAITNEHFDMFQYLFESLCSLWRGEHLKLILDEVMESRNHTLIDYVLMHPRTHVLFNYMTYLDRQLLIGYLLISSSNTTLFEPKLRLERPYMGPYTFYVLSTIDLVKDKFSPELDIQLTDDDLAEYIEGVGSD